MTTPDGEVRRFPAPAPLPEYGPLPRPRSMGEAIATLAREAFPAPAGVALVEFVTEEFTAVCPRTGQPDFCAVEITYQPRDWCLESKALKFYLWAFRDIGAFTEQVAASIAEDIYDAIHPGLVTVTVIQRPRGGLELKAVAIRSPQDDRAAGVPTYFRDRAPGEGDDA
jgi:7-cyano-7-deazaguanine reductase